MRSFQWQRTHEWTSDFFTIIFNDEKLLKWKWTKKKKQERRKESSQTKFSSNSKVQKMFIQIRTSLVMSLKASFNQHWITNVYITRAQTMIPKCFFSFFHSRPFQLFSVFPLDWMWNVDCNFYEKCLFSLGESIEKIAKSLNEKIVKANSKW